jgi:undecaprenyl-diphosphatase
MQYILAAVMGLVEGLTEFIPVSSTGHLILADSLLGFKDVVGEDAAKTFEIVIQFAAILAVVAAYPGRFARLCDVRAREGFAGLRGWTLLAITSVPAGLLGLVARSKIKECLFAPWPVVAALSVGAIWILAVERFSRRSRIDELDRVGWRQALAVGFWQCLALWPGMSRSSSTILGGMMSGVGRKAATEYSFFAAVPLITAATAYELYKSRGFLTAEHLPLFLLGSAVSFVSAWVSVRFLVRFLSSHTLAPFGWYRLGLSAVLVILVLRGLIAL